MKFPVETGNFNLRIPVCLPDCLFLDSGLKNHPITYKFGINVYMSSEISNAALIVNMQTSV